MEEPKKRQRNWQKAADKVNAKRNAEAPLFAHAGLIPQMTPEEAEARNARSRALAEEHLKRIEVSHEEAEARGMRFRLEVAALVSMEELAQLDERRTKIPATGEYTADFWWQELRRLAPERAEGLRACLIEEMQDASQASAANALRELAVADEASPRPQRAPDESTEEPMASKKPPSNGDGNGAPPPMAAPPDEREQPNAATHEPENRKAVYTIVESPGRKSRWVRIGIAFVNRDGSLNRMLRNRASQISSSPSPAGRSAGRAALARGEG